MIYREYEGSWQEDQYSPSADYFAKGDWCKRVFVDKEGVWMEDGIKRITLMLFGIKKGE